MTCFMMHVKKSVSIYLFNGLFGTDSICFNTKPKLGEMNVR